MAKNPRRQIPNPTSVKSDAVKSAALISRRGKKIIGLGVLVVLSGFWILTLADAAGQNWASTVSPILLVLGYTLIGVGIVFPDRESPASSTESPPSAQ